MGTSATAWCAIQEWIEAQEAYDSITYGIRSIELCRSPYGCSATHTRQITEACQAARRITGQFIGQDTATLGTLKAAKKIAFEQLKAAKAEKREIGTARQIRLALAA